MMTWLAIAAELMTMRRLSLPAVAVSAAVAATVALATPPALRMAPVVDPVAVAQLVRADHAEIDGYVSARLAADRARIAADDREWAQQRALAAADAASRVASVKPSTVRTPAGPVHVAHAGSQPPTPPAAAGPPLALLPAAPPPHRPVVERVRTALATVRRIPHWVTAGVQQAADWVTDVPVGTIVRWPERRFL